MRKMVLLFVFVAGCGVSAAAEGDGQLHGTINAEYNSRFIWRGYDAYPNNHSAFQPSIDVDLFGTGFGFYVWWSRANQSGFENSEWLTYTFYYGGMLFEDEAYATAYKAGYTYFSFPDEPSEGSSGPPPGASGHAQEIFGGFAWPKLLGVEGLVPSYAMFAYWPSDSNAFNRQNDGWAHVFALNYNIPVPGLISEDTQILQLGAHTVYNDSVGPAGNMADHDWSHAVFSIAMDFPINDTLTFTPGFNYQSSWDDSINTSDEYWTSLSLTYKF